MEEFANDQKCHNMLQSNGGEAWPLWAGLESAGSRTRQLPPAQVAAVVKRLPFAQNHMS